MKKSFLFPLSFWAAAQILVSCGTLPPVENNPEVDPHLYVPSEIIHGSDGEVTYLPGKGYGPEPVWADEFQGDSLDETNWNYELLPAGHYNEELQTYVRSDRTAGILREGDGVLALTALQTSPGIVSGHYESARLNTWKKREFTYGKIAARIKLPYGTGIWPAFWMLGADFAGLGGTVYWPDCGEVDIMEFFGGSTLGDNKSLAALHGPGYSGDFPDKAVYTLPEKDFKDDYHIFEIEWTENRITHLIDGKAFHTSSPEDVKGEWVFNKPYFLILNFAVGGWGFNPTSQTVFPQSLKVDWVRVYKKTPQ